MVKQYRVDILLHPIIHRDNKVIFYLYIHQKIGPDILINNFQKKRYV